MLILVGFQLLSLVLSFDIFESLTPPEMDFDIDLDADISWLTKCFSWLNIGGVPFMIILIFTLWVFGAIGLGLQSLTGGNLNQFFLLPFVVGLTVICLKFVFKITKPYLPKDYTEVVSEEDFNGKSATIIREKVDGIAEAKVIDQFGNTHYLLIQAKEEDVLILNQKVIILMKQENGFYQAI